MATSVFLVGNTVAPWLDIGAVETTTGTFTPTGATQS